MIQTDIRDLFVKNSTVRVPLATAADTHKTVSNENTD